MLSFIPLPYFKEWLQEQVECVESWVLLKLESSQNNEGAKRLGSFPYLQ